MSIDMQRLLTRHERPGRSRKPESQKCRRCGASAFGAVFPFALSSARDFAICRNPAPAPSTHPYFSNCKFARKAGDNSGHFARNFENYFQAARVPAAAAPWEGNRSSVPRFCAYRSTADIRRFRFAAGHRFGAGPRRMPRPQVAFPARGRFPSLRGHVEAIVQNRGERFPHRAAKAHCQSANSGLYGIDGLLH
jgi:hypothetical protein